jgi:uncharacterized protein YkwD
VRKAWSKLEPGELLALLRAARFEPEDRLLIAVFCHEVNLGEEFRAEILSLLEIDDLRDLAGVLYARKEGRPYPPGGFVAYKGRILTREEHAEEVHRERVASLRDRQVELYERLADHPVFRRLAKIRELREELDKAREYALALIFDEVKYFYPYRDRMTEYVPVQKEVDDRVAAVRAVWANEARVSLKPDAKLKGVLEEIERTNKELADLGVDNAEFRRKVEALTVYLDRVLTVRTYFRDAWELALLDYNAKIMEWNETAEGVASELERKQVRITNEYRMMMGRRALAIDDRLVRAARGHSEEQEREGYFSHFSPHADHRTPQQRMALQGYKGSAMSENIHRGSGTPEGAHYGWLHSSGHHRNILQKFWTEMGTGFAGRTWTQNFGRTQPKEFPSEEGK